MFRLDPNNRLVLDHASMAQLRSTQRDYEGIDWTTARRDLTWWTVPASYRQCELAALTKIDALMRAGVPAHPLMFTVTTKPDGNYRVILCVMTDRGDHALTCDHPDVVTMSELRESGHQIVYRTPVGGTLASVEAAIEQYR